MKKVIISEGTAVRTVTLNRPEKRNALDLEVMDGLTAAFSTPPGEAERVTVLRANGTAFCSGMDLTQNKEALGKPKVIEKMLGAIENYPLPVVAMVHGDAIAGGMELALHCDFVVANQDARFAMSLAQLGLAPTWFLTKKIIEVAGPVLAREILLLGEPIDASRLAVSGVIARSVSADGLEAAVDALVDCLTRNAPLSIEAMKATIERQMTFRDVVPYGDLNKFVEKISSSDDAEEGISARLERRTPVFRGL